MRRFRLFSIAASLLLLAALAPTQVFAQASCPMSLQTFRTITTSTYTLAVTDQCSTLVFSPTTAATAVALTMPNPATTFPVGYTVWIKSGNSGGVYMTPTTATLDGLTTQINVTTGQALRLVSDGTNWISEGGIGTTHHP